MNIITNESFVAPGNGRTRLSTPLEFLVKLVEINSGTMNTIGVNKVQDLIRHELELMGFTTEYFESPAKRYGKLLRGFLASDKKNAKTVTLVVHADTVFETADIFPVYVNENEGILKGPGVIDDKGGVVVALKGLSDFLRFYKGSYNIQFISSPNEELGSPGFNELLSAFGQLSALVLGFEPAHDNGDIISSRAGNRWYKIEVKGIEAHAGRADGEEINAAHELTGKISEMIQLKNKIPGIKLNVGHFHGGKDKFNIVCGHAEAKVDTRFSTHEQSEELHREMLSILHSPKLSSKSGETSEINYRIEDDCPPFPKQHSECHFRTKYKEIIGNVENQLIHDSNACGASDINYLSNPHNIAIDGLGPIGGGMHTDNEFLRIESLASRAESLTNFLTYLNSSDFFGGLNGSN